MADDDDTSSSPPPPSSTSRPSPSRSSQSPPPSSDSSPPPPSSTDSSPPPPSSDSLTPPPSRPPPSPSSHSSPPPSPTSPQAPSTWSSPPPVSDQPPTPPPPKSSREPSGYHKPDKSPSRRNGGDSPNNSPDDDPMVGVITGVVIGVVGFALLMAIVACMCCTAKKKKKQRPPMNMPYYTDEKGNMYFTNAGVPPRWQQHPSNNGHMGQQQGWHGGGSLSPPPAPLSGDMGYSSGPYGGPLLPPPSPNVALGFASRSSFTYEELAAATGGFSQANILGQGGFGYVYKGVLAGTGKEVAVKQLKSGSGQGEREFQAEVDIISRVHHRHLVSLVGYCIAGSQRMLVYEFVPNNTLEHHLYGKDVPVMDWPTRHRIALGAAKGLAYLHEDCHPKIIHRDIKAANILLDANFEAMVADFGLAKLTTDTNTHVSTRVMGTFGYLAPEYAASGKLTDRSDVFSFGVMMLELITGRRPIDITNRMEDSLVDWARPLLAQVLSGELGFEELVDERLQGDYNKVEVERMAACAAASVRHSARRRPKMSQVARALEGDVSLDVLHEGGLKPSSSDGNMARYRQLAFDGGEDTDDYTSDSSTTRRK